MQCIVVSLKKNIHSSLFDVYYQFEKLKQLSLNPARKIRIAMYTNF